MALLFADSADHYDTAHGFEKWDSFNSAQIRVGEGRSGGNAIFVQYPQSVTKYFPNRQTIIMGAAFKSSDSSIGIFSIADAGTQQVWLSLSPSGILAVGSGSTTLAASPSGTLNNTVYSYVELKATIAPGIGGSVEVRVNGVPVASASGVNTSVSGSAYANMAGTQNGSAGNWFDDFYICDNTGTTNNDFLGDVSVALAIPNGDGRVNAFAQVGGTSGDNYTSVNEIPPDDDTSYVHSSTVGAIDAYTLSSIGTPSAVLAVQIVASSRKDDSGSRSLALGFGNGTTEAYGGGVSLGNDYFMIKQPFDTNPITEDPWEPSDIASGQIAVQVVS